MKYPSERKNLFKQFKGTNLVLKYLLAFHLFQSSAYLPAEAEINYSQPKIRISQEENKYGLSIQLNEDFRWERTRFESLKRFPQPWIELPDIPHEIWIKENKEMEMRQTDMVFIGDYQILGQYSIKAEILGLNEIVGTFNPDNHLLEFEGLKYAPFFETPEIILEESNDLRTWETIGLENKLPREYQWPLEIRINLEINQNSGNSFYRLTVVN